MTRGLPGSAASPGSGRIVVDRPCGGADGSFEDHGIDLPGVDLEGVYWGVEFLRDAAAGELTGILGFEERPLVSADFTNDTRSGIVDGPSTMVVDDRMVKVLIWYDNEYGYTCNMLRFAKHVTA